MRHDDALWLAELRGPDTVARRQAVADLRDYLCKTLARGFGHQFGADEVEDLAQESLLRILENLHRFEEQSRLSTWAAAIAVNCTLSELRRRRHKHVSIDDAAALAVAALEADAPDAGAPDVAVLRRAIDEALTDRQRQAILAKLGGLPLMELARRLETSQGAIYKLLHDARLRLRAYLERAADDGGIP